jgi:predicted RNA-binding protein YlqC (UPF0109 family)
MHTDIKDLKVSRALRRLGNMRVTDWEFSDILPKVKELAATEVDVIDLFKRTANFRINDWEIGSLSGRDDDLPHLRRPVPPSPEEAKACIDRLSAFLGFATRKLIDNPDQVSIKVSTPSPSEIRFRLILTQRDSAAFIGHGGHTAAAIRNLIQDAGTRARFFVDLKILSHKEERELQLTHPTRAQWKNVKV